MVSFHLPPPPSINLFLNSEEKSDAKNFSNLELSPVDSVSDLFKKFLRTQEAHSVKIPEDIKRTDDFDDFEDFEDFEDAKNEFCKTIEGDSNLGIQLPENLRKELPNLISNKGGNGLFCEIEQWMGRVLHSELRLPETLEIFVESGLFTKEDSEKLKKEYSAGYAKTRQLFTENMSVLSPTKKDVAAYKIFLTNKMDEPDFLRGDKCVKNLYDIIYRIKRQQVIAEKFEHKNGPWKGIEKQLVQKIKEKQTVAIKGFLSLKDSIFAPNGLIRADMNTDNANYFLVLANFFKEQDLNQLFGDQENCIIQIKCYLGQKVVESSKNKGTAPQGPSQSSPPVTRIDLNEPRKLKRVQNEDKGRNLCYVNSLLQALFSFECVKKKIKETKEVKDDHGKSNYSSNILRALRVVLEEYEKNPSSDDDLYNKVSLLRRAVFAGKDNTVWPIKQITAQQDQNQLLEQITDVLKLNFKMISIKRAVIQSGNTLVEVKEARPSQKEATNTVLHLSIPEAVPQVEKKVKQNCFIAIIIKIWRAVYDFFTCCCDDDDDDEEVEAVSSLPSPQTVNLQELIDNLPEPGFVKDQNLKFTMEQGSDKETKKFDGYNSLEQGSGEPPEFLPIVIKRFKYSSQSNVQKLSNPIVLPQNKMINLSKFWKKTGAKANHLKYRLKAVSVHAGMGANNGHYKAFVERSNGAWYQCDDAKVTNKQSAEVDKNLQDGYIFFFEKVDSSTNNAMLI